MKALDYTIELKSQIRTKGITVVARDLPVTKEDLELLKKQQIENSRSMLHCDPFGHIFFGRELLSIKAYDFLPGVLHVADVKFLKVSLKDPISMEDTAVPRIKAYLDSVIMTHLEEKLKELSAEATNTSNICGQSQCDCGPTPSHKSCPTTEPAAQPKTQPATAGTEEPANQFPNELVITEEEKVKFKFEMRHDSRDVATITSDDILNFRFNGVYYSGEFISKILLSSKILGGHLNGELTLEKPQPKGSLNRTALLSVDKFVKAFAESMDKGEIVVKK